MVGKRKLFVGGTCNYNLGRDMRGKCWIITSRIVIKMQQFRER